MKREKQKSRLQQDLARFGNLRALCLAGVLTAMSIILGKFLQFPNPFQQVIRISFENLPAILAGLTMGPFMGASVAVIADLLGCVCYGYTINPIITLGALCVGWLAGFSSHYLVRRPLVARVSVAVALSHLCGSVVVKTFGLAAWYLAKYNMGLWELMLWRLLTYALIGTAEGVLIYLLLRHRGLTSQLERMLKK